MQNYHVLYTDYVTNRSLSTKVITINNDWLNVISKQYRGIIAFPLLLFYNGIALVIVYVYCMNVTCLLTALQVLKLMFIIER